MHWLHTRISQKFSSHSVSYCQLIQIFHHWINASLLESYEYNKGLYKVAVSWSGISTMWRKTDKVWWYCKIPLVHSGLVVMKPCLTSGKGFVGRSAVVLFTAVCVNNITFNTNIIILHTIQVNWWIIKENITGEKLKFVRILLINNNAFIFFVRLGFSLYIYIYILIVIVMV